MSWFDLGLAMGFSIFVTCTLFFVLYGMAYLIVTGIINLTRKIKNKFNEGKDEKGLAGNEDKLYRR